MGPTSLERKLRVGFVPARVNIGLPGPSSERPWPILTPTAVGIIGAYGRSKQWAKLDSTTKRMAAAGIQLSETGEALLGAYVEGEQWERAEGTLSAMRAAGQGVRVETYDALLGAYVAAKQWERVEPMLEAMRAAGVKPRMHWFDAVIR
jgi:pentatricopeptide repeat protein